MRYGLIFAVSVALLVVLAGCGQVTYKDYADGSFSAKYPDWPTDGGSDIVSVAKSGCQVRVNVENENFGNNNLQVAIDKAIVPVLEQLGLTVQSNVVGNEAMLQLTGNKVTGKQKYLVCDGKLYKVSAACVRENPLIDEVVSSASCAA